MAGEPGGAVVGAGEEGGAGGAEEGVQGGAVARSHVALDKVACGETHSVAVVRDKGGELMGRRDSGGELRECIHTCPYLSTYRVCSLQRVISPATNVPPPTFARFPLSPLCRAPGFSLV